MTKVLTAKIPNRRCKSPVLVSELRGRSMIDFIRWQDTDGKEIDLLDSELLKT